MPKVKTIKISKETYARLITLKGKGVRITDLAGSWDVSQDELAEIKVSLREAWRKWRLPEL